MRPSIAVCIYHYKCDEITIIKVDGHIGSTSHNLGVIIYLIFVDQMPPMFIKLVIVDFLLKEIEIPLVDDVREENERDFVKCRQHKLVHSHHFTVAIVAIFWIVQKSHPNQVI